MMGYESTVWTLGCILLAMQVLSLPLTRREVSALLRSLRALRGRRYRELSHKEG